MGAAALVTDREVMSRLRAYINLESIGSSGTSVLFETGPATGGWCRRGRGARRIRAAARTRSRSTQRLPNDTDFSILKTRGRSRAELRGGRRQLRVPHRARHSRAAVARDSSARPARTSSRSPRRCRPPTSPRATATRATFFDIGGTVAVSYGTTAHWLISALALITGVIAWVRVSGDAVRTNGVLRWILTIVWGWLGAAARGVRDGRRHLAAAIRARGLSPVVRAAGAAARCCCSSAASRSAGAWSGWAAGCRREAHPARHPALTWSVALPVWIAAGRGLPVVRAGRRLSLDCAAVERRASCSSIAPPHNDPIVRVASLVVLCGRGHDVAARGARAGALHRRDHGAAADRHAVLRLRGGAERRRSHGGSAAHRGRGRRTAAAPSPGRSPRCMFVALAATFSAAYTAPAYTHEQPLRRYVRALQEGEAPTATWEVASIEPGLDLAPDAPGEWTPTGGDAAPAGIPWGRYSLPFVFRAAGPSLGSAPASIGAFEVKPLADGSQLSISVDPARAGPDGHVRAAGGNHAGAQQPARHRPPRPLGGDVRRRPCRGHRLGSEPADPASVSRGRQGGGDLVALPWRHRMAGPAGVAAAGRRGMVGQRHLGAAAEPPGRDCAGAPVTVISVAVTADSVMTNRAHRPTADCQCPKTAGSNNRTKAGPQAGLSERRPWESGVGRWELIGA